MRSKFYIASRLAKITPDNSELKDITEFLTGIKENEKLQMEFFSYCKQWKLAPWIWIQLKRYTLSKYLIPAIYKSFKDEYNAINKDNEARNLEALRYLKEFKKEGIEVIILKGNLFMHTIYDDSGYKRMNDFDMLIHPEDWPKVQEIYFKLDYIPLGFGWSGEKQEAAKFSHAGMSFISPDYTCITGTQWGLKSPTSKYNKHIIKDIWATASDFKYYNLTVKQLSTEYNLLHLILHMGVYKCGIRDCMDVYNLYEKGINEDLFLKIAKEANAIDKAYLTLMFTNLCCNTISETLLNKLKTQSKGFLLRRTNARIEMAERTGDFQLSYNDYFHDVEMNVFYFNLFHKTHQKLPKYLRIVKLMIWPEMKIALRFCDKADQPVIWNKLKARLKAPYFTFSLIGEEIGLGITFMLFLKLFIDTLVSIKNYFMKKETYFEYIQKRGINPKDIQNAVSKIQ